MAKAKLTPVDNPPPTDNLEGDDSLDVLELDQNLDDYPEPELLPPAWYKAEIQNVTQRTNQKGTGRYYAVEIVIPPENFPPDYDTDNWPDGLKLFYNLLRVPTSGDRRSVANIKRFMASLGLAIDTPRIDPNEWIGRPVRVKVEHGTWEGNRREQIARNGIQASE